MENLNLQYTGAESLELLKEYYPNDWQDTVITSMVIIKKVAKTMKTTPQDAFNRLVKHTKDRVKFIEFFAGLYYLELETKMNQIADLKAKQYQLGEQREKLEDGSFCTIEEKQTLRGWYMEKATELQNEINTISASITTGNDFLTIKEMIYEL